MKTIRDIEVETCCVCGEEFDKINLREIFTGRTKYICPSCYDLGQRQADAKTQDWRNSSRGKQIISAAEKFK